MCNRWLHSAKTLAVDGRRGTRCADREAYDSKTSRTSAATSASTWPNATTSRPSRWSFERDGSDLRLRPGLSARARDRRTAVAAVPQYRGWLKSGELDPDDGQHDGLRRHRGRHPAMTASSSTSRRSCIERYGALNLASNLLASGLPARIESKNAKVVHAAGEGIRSADQGREDPPYRAVSFLTWQVSNVCCRAAARWLAAADERNRRDHRTRSTRSTRSCWRCRRCCRRRPTPMQEPRIVFLEA